MVIVVATAVSAATSRAYQGGVLLLASIPGIRVIRGRLLPLSPIRGFKRPKKPKNKY